MTRSTGEEKKYLKVLNQRAKKFGMTAGFCQQNNNKRYIELYNAQGEVVARAPMGANNDLNVPGAKERINVALFSEIEKKFAVEQMKRAAAPVTETKPRPSKEEIGKAMASHVKGSFHQLEQMLTRLCAPPVASPKAPESASKEREPENAQGKSWFAGKQITPTVIIRRSRGADGRKKAALG